MGTTVPRNDPPGRLGYGLVNEAIEQDYQGHEEEDTTGTAAANIAAMGGVFQYEYGHFSFNAANIGGSNETERVRMRIDLSQWASGMLCCSASSDGGGFDLNAEYYDDGLVAYDDLGPVMTFPPSENIDTDGGYQEGAWFDLATAAKDQGLSIVRINRANDSASDDIYGLVLILRR